MPTITEAVTLVSGIIALYFLVYKPMNSNALSVRENAMNTKANTEALEIFRKEIREELKEIRKNQKESLDDIEKKKHEAHANLWKHNEEQDRILQEHTLKIKIIEKEVGINGEKE